MEMRDRVDVGPRLVDLRMDMHLGDRPEMGRARDEAAVQVADEEISGRQRRAALVEILDQQAVAGQAGADMAAIAHQPLHVQKARAAGDLGAQARFGFGVLIGSGERHRFRPRMVSINR